MGDSAPGRQARIASPTLVTLFMGPMGMQFVLTGLKAFLEKG
jgi:hypothetical protein